ncbi:transposase [Gordonia phthalatica]|uniref:Transposase n=1 Tax=Gordonia phthalatica TaxID=1136941 RepID=A0A0N9N373_9ACTN|nr:transposase [Gordonia phthalatica]
MFFVGDDWASDHHDLVVIDDAEKVLARARVLVGPDGITQFAETLARAAVKAAGRQHRRGSRSVEEQVADLDPDQVMVCIEVDHGPWVQALAATGYHVFGVDPLQAKRFRESFGSSGAKSDPGDALALAEMVRSRHHTLTEVGGDTAQVTAIKILARAHQRAVWDRTRYANRLRAALREYFPMILLICSEFNWSLHDRTVIGILMKAPTPDQAAKLTVRQLLPLLKRRQNKDAKAARIQQILRSSQLEVAPEIVQAYAINVAATVRTIVRVNDQITELEEQVGAHFSEHPDAEIYLSQPGVGLVVGARLCGEYGDDRTRFRSAKARRNFSQTSPITIQSGKSKIVCARAAGNDWLLDATFRQANAAILNDPYCYAYYRKQRDRGAEHNAALRQLANKLVGILHGCLARHQQYNPAIAWAHASISVAA